jgi:ketosteroid isomerase-like protein
MTVTLIVLELLAHTRQAPQTPADERELSRLEHVWNDAHEQGDAAPLDRLWADDLEVAVPRMSVMAKTEALSFVRSAQMKFSRYRSAGLRVRLYGDSAVVTGRLERVRTMAGKELTDDWRFTKVYVRHPDGWKVVAFHASEAAR